MHSEELAGSCRTRYGFQRCVKLINESSFFCSCKRMSKNVVVSQSQKHVTYFKELWEAHHIVRCILNGSPYKVLLRDSHSWLLKLTINLHVTTWISLFPAYSQATCAQYVIYTFITCYSIVYLYSPCTHRTYTHLYSGFIKLVSRLHTTVLSSSSLFSPDCLVQMLYKRHLDDVFQLPYFSRWGSKPDPSIRSADFMCCGVSASTPGRVMQAGVTDDLKLHSGFQGVPYLTGQSAGSLQAEVQIGC